MNMLIIGGTSGLGLEIAEQTSCERVIVTGRRNWVHNDQDFRFLRIDSFENIDTLLDSLLRQIPEIDILVYAAGFFQEGTISSLSTSGIARMMNVGLYAPALLVQKLLLKQKRLKGFIAITSTSQWTPRKVEPIYTAVKAGLGMLANSLALDDQVEKVLVAAPSGMCTNFWENDGRDTSKMLDPAIVAGDILVQYDAVPQFKYKFIKILRDPYRIEVVESR